MNYIDCKLKTFKLEDLVGRNIFIKSFWDQDSTELTVAIDTSSGEVFVLQQTIHPSQAEAPND